MAITVTTFDDLVEHLNDVRYGGATDKDQRILRRAVRAAYRDLVYACQWNYFLREYQINLSAQLDGTTSKTLNYDHTGGAAERLVTFSGVTLTSDAAWIEDNAPNARLKIGGHVYDVERYVSSTTIVLSEVLNPGADVSSTSDWTLYRNSYPFSDNFNGLDEIHNKDNLWAHHYVEPNEWMKYERYYGNIGEPFFWTVMADPSTLGRHIIRVAGYPTDTDKLFFIYRSSGSEPILSGGEAKATAGTLSTTAGSTSVTGSGTSFDSSMVNSVLRVGDASNIPTGYEGQYPYAEQHVIRSVESGTALTLKTAAATTGSSLKYKVSDPLDVERTMINALQRAAEWQLDILTRDERKSATSFQLYRQAVLSAMENDSKLEMVRGQVGEAPWQLIFGDVSNYDFGPTVSV